MKRRQFVKTGTLILGGLPSETAKAQQAGVKPSLILGLMTDIHYADKSPRGNRHYRESLAKAKEAVDLFKEKGASALICLGDLIDEAPTVEEEIAFLNRISRVLDQSALPRYHVLGNHCVSTLTKEEFFAHSGTSVKKGYYSLDLYGFHLVILDACFNNEMASYGRNNFKWTDPNIPPAQLTWLTKDLNQTALPVVVFIHQRIDLEPENHYAVNQAPEVRKILQRSGKVKAVFQGHSHRNELQTIDAISYCTLQAMVEGTGASQNGYALLELYADGSLKLEGFRSQKTRAFSSSET